jgi:hypothetical protein
LNKPLKTLFGLLFSLTALFIAPAFGKRLEPQPVTPVVYQGVEYSASGDGRIQYVVATAVATSKQLWKLKISRIHIKPWIEEDNQWVFISELKLDGNALIVKDERGRCHRVDLRNRHVKKQPCN